jgi:hypothetical protein
MADRYGSTTIKCWRKAEICFERKPADPKTFRDGFGVIRRAVINDDYFQ